MSRRRGGSSAPGTGWQSRLDQKRSVADHRGQLARQLSDTAAKRAAALAPPPRAERDVDAYGRALGSLRLYQIGRPDELFVAPAYVKLVEAISKAACEGGRQTVLFWPATDISLAAGAVLSCLADCLSASPIVIDHRGESLPALAKPAGLRAVLFPAANTAHRALRDVYVDKIAVERCHTRHQVRAIRRPDEGALADYHQALSRVKTLTGRARDGKIYDEFRHPTLDEVVPSCPLGGPLPANGHLLWHVRTKTDLKEHSRTGLADDPASGPFFLFALRADDPISARLKAQPSPLDVLLIDLTRRGRARLGLGWKERVREATSKFEDARRGVGVVALTDDPWTFDATRFEVLAKETRNKSRMVREPSQAKVVFAPSSAVAAPAKREPVEWRGCERIAVEGFAGDLIPELAKLRDLAATATASGDLQAADAIRRLMGRLGSAASLPTSLGALSDFVSAEMGLAVAAEQVAAYQIAGLLDDLTRPGSTLSQIAYDDLTEAMSRARDLRSKADRTTPMASLLEAAVTRYLGSSSKCLFVFRSDLLAELAYTDLAARLPDLEARIDNGMIHFADVRGAEDITSLPDTHRNQFFRMILVAPTRGQLLTWMAKPWLPKELLILSDVDTIRSSSRDALRLAGFPELSVLQARLQLLARRTQDCAARLGGAAIDLDRLERPADDVEFPTGSVVDLAGPSKSKRDLVEFTLSNDLKVVARPRTRLVSRLPSHALTSYGEIEASKVGVGDEICVMGPAFIERMRPLLNISAVAAEEIRAYHDLVREKFAALPGGKTSVRLRTISEAMGEPRVAPETIRYWVSLQDETDKALHDVVPHAPRDRDTFLRFMAALGVSEAVARRFWAWAVIEQRSVRQRVGSALYEAYRSILVDPHGVDASQIDRLAGVKAVRSASEQFVAAVRARREYRG